MDEYKNNLHLALMDYAAECEYENAEVFFTRGNDGGYNYLNDMDSLSMALDERGALLFSINYTRQGEQGEPYLDVSYWSKAIDKEISFGEAMPNIESVAQFIEWAGTIRSEMLALESKLPLINEGEVQ